MNPLVLFAFIGLASAGLLPEYGIVHPGGLIGVLGKGRSLGFEQILTKKEGELLTSGLLSGRSVAGNEGIIGLVGKPVPIQGVQTEGIEAVEELRTPILKTEIPVVTVEKVVKPIIAEKILTKVPVVELYKPELRNVEGEVYREIPIGQKYYKQQIHRAFPYLFGEVYGERAPVYRQEYPFYGKHMSSYVYPYGQEKQFYPEMYKNEYPLIYDNVHPFRYEYPIYGKQYQDKPYVYGYPYYSNELQYVQPERQIYQRYELPLTYKHVSYPYRYYGL